ncbi:hypothetical protein RB595_007077 [Gaeumannomyces hyphopodioides]
MSTPMLAAAKRGFREIQGVVVSAGLMDRTVKVRVGGRVWNDQVKKHFKRPETHLVHDPNNSLATGDIISMQPGWRCSRHKRHVVTQIIAAAGRPAEERPPVPSVADRVAEADAKRAAKLERRTARDAEAEKARLAEKEEKKRLKRARLARVEATYKPPSAQGGAAPAPAPAAPAHSSEVSA